MSQDVHPSSAASEEIGTAMRRAMLLYAEMAGRMHWLLLSDVEDCEKYLRSEQALKDKEKWRTEAQELFRAIAVPR